MNSKGYPFSWDVLEDYTSDVKTLTTNADKWKQKFNLHKIIIVFNRGMISNDNLKHLENSKSYLYITAMDKDQLTGVEEAFRELKSFLKFKPSFVYTDKHVRAHYTICILGYLLDVTIINKSSLLIII